MSFSTRLQSASGHHWVFQIPDAVLRSPGSCSCEHWAMVVHWTPFCASQLDSTLDSAMLHVQRSIASWTVAPSTLFSAPLLDSFDLQQVDLVPHSRCSRSDPHLTMVAHLASFYALLCGSTDFHLTDLMKPLDLSSCSVPYSASVVQTTSSYALLHDSTVLQQPGLSMPHRKGENVAIVGPSVSPWRHFRCASHPDDFFRRYLAQLPHESFAQLMALETQASFADR